MSNRQTTTSTFDHSVDGRRVGGDDLINVCDIIRNKEPVIAKRRGDWWSTRAIRRQGEAAF